MRFLINTFEICGAILSSKMTGDLRSHFKWTLYVFAFAFLCAYLHVRP